MAVTLYSTGCPMCKVLETKLNHKDIEFDTVEDVQIMLDKGFMSAPNLEIDGKVYDFSSARKLVDSYDNTEEISFEDFVKSQEQE